MALLKTGRSTPFSAFFYLCLCCSTLATALCLCCAGPAAAQGGFEDDFDDFDDVEAPVQQAQEQPESEGVKEPPKDGPPAIVDPEAVRWQRFRLHNTYSGTTGGVWAVDAGSAPPATFRTQLSLDFFMAGGYLEPGDNNNYLGGSLSASWTATDFLEVYGSLESSANANDQEQPELFQVLGDTTLGVKPFYSVNPWLTVGGDLRIVLLNSVGGIGPSMAGTSLGIRGNASADLRRIENDLPLIARFSLDYFLDNSAQVVEDLEMQRFASLSDAEADPSYERRHLLTRIERFALGINRVDLFSFTLGVEAPLTAAREFYVHPMLEWNLGIPVNRQGYSCLYDQADEMLGGDSCLAQQGAGAFPQKLTLGVRVFPPLRGIGLLVAADIGLTGTSVFVRELAPTKPYDVIFALSFAYDARPLPPARPAEELRPAATAAPSRGRIRGQVVDAETGQAVAGARIAYPGRDLTAQQTDGEGRFTSYRLEPGEVDMEISHPDFEPGSCSALILPPPYPEGHKGSVKGSLSLSMDDFTDGESESLEKQPVTPPAASAEPPVRETSIKCALKARPRKAAVKGRLTDSSGLPVSGASIELSGPERRTVSSQSTGAFEADQLVPGFYTLRAEAEGYFAKQSSVQLSAAETSSVELTLVARPARSLVRLTGREIAIRRKIKFARGGAQIDPASESLLAEIADLLGRRTEIQLVEIQGHTDSTGSPTSNLELSQRRADAVRERLIENGVSPSRLESKGYGQDRPLVPNLTAANRARNRRVQFVIEKRD